ncbi:hypothetical protein [Rhizorhabdus sp.]|uniref:hypothetical protein n=1 Tax=Rhizorhabdus sp. TaxID=1968843 RepID=UPI0035B0EA84
MDAPIVQDLVSSTTLAFKLQDDQDTYAAPTTADTLSVANVQLRPNDITLENPEYRGSIHRPGPFLIGTTWDLTYEVFLRGPGGAAPPLADAFILGRILRTLGFTENVVSAAIPAALEDLGVGSTTTAAKLGASATGTADLYKGLALSLPGAGPVTARSLSMIAAYSAAKLATIAEELDAPPAGKYQIPTQLAYLLSPSDTPPVASASTWLGGMRYNLQGLAPSSATLTFPTASRDGGSDLPKLAVTFSGDMHSYDEEACPAIDVSLPVPPFKGGKMMIANKPMGGSSLSLDLSPRVAYRPNPNKTTGSEGATLVETRRSLAMTLNKTALSYLDLLALSAAQGEHNIQALYGYGSGNFVGFGAFGARFSTPEPQAGGDFYTDQLTAYIDDPDRTVALTFPFWGA